MHLQLYEFKKVSVPEKKEEKIKLMAKLKKYNTSLTQYESALKQKGLE